jgi:uncharacterized membrane protein YdbT with pleckstrin-like domain
MTYAESVLQPGEKIIIAERLHWIVYASPILTTSIGISLLAFEWLGGGSVVLGALILIIGILTLVRAWFNRWITEFAVTTRRVIYKKGFISRHTSEMNMDKVESVDVSQSLLGRVLDFGSIHVLGTGQGIEHLHRIGAPLKLRSAILAQ